MDTSKEYVKMCEGAEEVQEEWIIRDWDYCYCKDEGKVVVLSGYTTDAGYYGHESNEHNYGTSKIVSSDDCNTEDKEGHIWIPRQDQLQEMLLRPPNTAFPDIPTLLRLFIVFVVINYPMYESMEQLWLAFVMREKFNKSWDGEKWL